MVWFESDRYRRLIQHGIDVVTLGDHIYRKQEIIDVLLAEGNIVRPANMPGQAPGRQWSIVRRGGSAVCRHQSDWPRLHEAG